MYDEFDMIDEFNDNNGESMHVDDKGRNYIIIYGTRCTFKDYLCVLDRPNDIRLKRFLVVTDCSSKKQCSVIPSCWLDHCTGMIWFPVPSIVSKKVKTQVVDDVLEKAVPHTTIIHPFIGKNYKLAWRQYPLKAVYMDFDCYSDALKYIDEEGSIAAEVSTLPDDVDVVTKDLATIAGKKRKQQPPLRYDSPTHKTTDSDNYSQKKIVKVANIESKLPNTQPVDILADSKYIMPNVTTIEMDSSKTCLSEKDHLLETFAKNRDLYVMFKALFGQQMCDTVSVIFFKKTLLYKIIKKKVSSWKDIGPQLKEFDNKNNDKTNPQRDETSELLLNKNWETMDSAERFDALLRRWMRSAKQMSSRRKKHTLPHDSVPQHEHIPTQLTLPLDTNPELSEVNLINANTTAITDEQHQELSNDLGLLYAEYHTQEISK